VFVLGGDTNQGPDLEVTVVAAGTVPEAAVTTRVGAAPEDHVYASGPLGLGGALAASVFLGLPDGLGEEGFRPGVRLRHGRALRGIASASMDTSDGLVATLDQIARVNEVAIRVEADLEKILHAEARRVRAITGLPPLPFLASPHGEFELVFTVPPARVEALAQAAQSLAWEPLLLGRVEAGEGLSLRGRAIDGAAVRNLLAGCGGDPRAWLEHVLRA
jgi:thiamine-monophosphate kinase